MKHQFIEDHWQRYGVKALCEVLRVSRSGYYAARRRPPSARRQRQVALTERIREVHAASRETYGAPRVHAELHAQGVACCRNTVAKLMRQAQIVPRSIRASTSRPVGPAHAVKGCAHVPRPGQGHPSIRRRPPREPK